MNEPKPALSGRSHGPNLPWLRMAGTTNANTHTHKMEAEYKEEYKGYQIAIFRDPDCNNPYDDGDYMPPALVQQGRAVTDYLEARDALVPTDEQYMAHGYALWEAMGMGDDAPSMYPDGDEPDGYEELIDAIRESTDMDSLEQVARVLGIPAVYVCIDQVDMLVVWTPAWGNMLGVTPEMARSDNYRAFRECAAVYAAWLRGNTYRYETTSPDGMEEWGVGGYVEVLDNIEDMYVLAEARREVDAAMPDIEARVTFGGDGITMEIEEHGTGVRYRRTYDVARHAAIDLRAVCSQGIDAGWATCTGAADPDGDTYTMAHWGEALDVEPDTPLERAWIDAVRSLLVE